VAAAPVGGHEAIAAQQLQGLPYGLPADPEVPGQPPFAGEPFAGRHGAVAQFAEQLRGDPPVQGLSFGRRVVVRGGAGHAAPPVGDVR
jgi:hypothetical protein